MIVGYFHKGSGLGDQLFRYVTVRVLAEEKGFKWDMINHDDFKGNSFMNIGLPKHEPDTSVFKVWTEKDVRDKDGNDIRSYDPEINFVEDNTIIDGSFEDSKYWGHRLRSIDKWLEVEALEVPDTTCVIGFRGGEYATQPDLFLDDGPYSYWRLSMAKMLTEHPQIKHFQVHTDDPELAKTIPCFSSCEIVDNHQLSHSQHTNMGYNWRAMRYAKYAIIPNSAFYIMPRLLRQTQHHDPGTTTIAPRYWARRNKKVWARPACYYNSFTYL